MKVRHVLCAAAFASAVVVSSGVAFAGTTVKAVRGNVAGATDANTETGYFRLADVTKDGTEWQNLFVYVRNLETPADPAATFEVVLTDSAGATTADLGPLNVFGSSKTRGWFRFDSRKSTAVTPGVTDLKAFSGGTLHVKLAGADVATSAIPSFVELDGPAQPTDQPSNAITFGYGSVIMVDASFHGSGPVAKLTAFAGNTQWGVDQAIAVGGYRFTAGATYTVVLTGATQDTIGTFKASWFFGFGGVAISTRRGDTIPGGALAALAGRGIEIRDSTGAAVLTGTFPSLN